jgi:hypothetical protein
MKKHCIHLTPDALLRVVDLIYLSFSKNNICCYCGACFARI